MSELSESIIKMINEMRARGVEPKTLAISKAAAVVLSAEMHALSHGLAAPTQMTVLQSIMDGNATISNVPIEVTKR